MKYFPFLLLLLVACHPKDSDKWVWGHTVVGSSTVQPSPVSDGPAMIDVIETVKQQLPPYAIAELKEIIPGNALERIKQGDISGIPVGKLITAAEVVYGFGIDTQVSPVSYGIPHNPPRKKQLMRFLKLATCISFPSTETRDATVSDAGDITDWWHSPFKDTLSVIMLVSDTITGRTGAMRGYHILQDSMYYDYDTRKAAHTLIHFGWLDRDKQDLAKELIVWQTLKEADQ